MPAINPKYLQTEPRNGESLPMKPLEAFFFRILMRHVPQERGQVPREPRLEAREIW